jgi:Ca2+-binding EF-hand superfamily protein
MQFNQNQLKSFREILEKMYGGSNQFMPKSKFENIKTFTDKKNNLYISYMSTKPTIDGMSTDTRYMAIDSFGTIEYLSLEKDEEELENLYKTLTEIKI